MITFEKALDGIIKHTTILGVKKVLIEESIGMTLAEDIYSKVEMPPFNKSAVDGYALRASDVKTTPVVLRNIGLIKAGDSFGRRLKTGECVKIMTGAPLPEGADSVVMVESTQATGRKIMVLKTLGKRANVCLKAEDLKSGQKVLVKGTQICASHVAVLAAVGRKFVKAIARPRVAVLNTGGEIAPLGSKLPENCIYNSNGPMLAALFRSDGIQVRPLGVAKDERRDLEKAIKKGLDTDILLISGGVSVGDYDLVPEVLKGLGVKQVFHKVKIKPGKPLFFGVKNKTIVFGVPGNPLAGFLAYLVFVRPALRKMQDSKNYYPVFQEGVLEKLFSQQANRKNFVLARVTKKLGQYYLSPLASHGSADVVSLSQADGFFIADKDVVTMEKNARVKFITWKII